MGQTCSTLADYYYQIGIPVLPKKSADEKAAEANVQPTPTPPPAIEVTTTPAPSAPSVAETVADAAGVNAQVAETWQPEHQHMMRADARLDQKRRYHAVDKSIYILPADVQEQDRLELQHILYRYSFGKLFHMPIEDVLEKGGKILDCGCGPGSWARDVAAKYPKADVYGVDMAKSLFDGVEVLPNMQFTTGNVLDGLPFPDNTFDAVFQRLLIAGVPKDKWVDVIKELIRVTKPGGYIELVETNTELHRRGEIYDKLHKGLLASMALRGVDMQIGDHLPDRAKEAGLEGVTESICSFPIGWGGRFGELQRINVESGYIAIKPFLSKAFEMSGDEYDQLVVDAMDDCVKNETYYQGHSVYGMVKK